MAFFGFLTVIVVLAFLTGEVHGLRQTMRERFTRTDAELHTIESILDVHRGILDGLETRQGTMKGTLDEISGAVCRPVDAASDSESRLSKAMEEGVMNLMGYAAGKAGTGIEVGLG